MSKINQAYERAIEPNMKIIAEVSRQFKIPMFATFQVAPTEFKCFCLNEERSNWPKIKYMAYLNKTWSLDDFLAMVMEDAIQHGHDSAILKAMGIPSSPQENAVKAKEIAEIMSKNKKNKGD